MHRVRLLLLILVLCTTATTAQDFWDALGGPSSRTLPGDVCELVLRGGDTVYACVRDGFAASFDGGRSWQRRTIGLSHRVDDMAVDSAGTILAISHAHGVFRSTDAGMNWHKVNDGLPAPSTKYNGYDLFDVCYNDADEAWYIASAKSTILRMPTGGNRWEAITVDTANARLLSIISARNGNLVACGDNGIYTWNRAQSEWGHTGDKGVFLSRGDTRLYCTLISGGYLVSDDHGESWEPRTGGEGLTHFHIFDLGADGLYLGGPTMLQYGEVYHSPDTGRTWNRIDNLSIYASYLNALVKLPSGGMLAGMRWGMLISESGHDFWSEIKQGWEYGEILDVITTPQGWIYGSGRQGADVLDPGRTDWTPLLLEGYTHELLRHADGTLLASTWPGVLRSTDDGRSWDSLILGYNQSTFLIEDARGVVYTGIVDSLVYRSSDAGATWLPGKTWIPRDEVLGAAYADGSIFLFTKNLGLYRVDTALTAAEQLFTADAVGYSYVFTMSGREDIIASGRDAAILSRDRGKTWERLRDPEEGAGPLTLATMDGNGVLYGMFLFYDDAQEFSNWPESRLYKTSDFGVSWTRMHLPQPMLRYTFLGILDDRKLYLVSESEGVFRSRDAVTAVDSSPATIPVDHGITLWPQPARDRLMLTWRRDTEVHTLLMHDCMGRQVLRRGVHTDATGSTLSLDIRGFRPGMYVISLLAAGEVLRTRVMVAGGR